MASISYSRHQFPPVIIRHAVWLYLRFTLSLRDVEDLLAERGITVSYETVRRCEGHRACALRKTGNEARMPRWSAHRNRQGPGMDRRTKTWSHWLRRRDRQ